MLELHPRKAALCSPGPTTLEVLLRIDPAQLPPRKAPSQRPPVNLSLVLDRSGSMAGEKWTLTLDAACQAVRRLDPADYLAAVAFDDQIDTIYQGNVSDPEGICAQLRALSTRNSTDLFGGWQRGAQLLNQVVKPGRLSRAVVLTDGEANHGEINPEVICQRISKAAWAGLQTTTLGFGAGYNEQLLRSMASSGFGNHGYIESAQRLSAFFEEEMHSLLWARGTSVRLRLTPAAGVQIQCLAEVQVDREGRVLLADLVDGKALALVLRLEIPQPPAEGEVLQVELSWDDLDAGEPRSASAALRLPSLNREAWLGLPNHPEVEAYLALAEAQRRRLRAMHLLELGQEDIAVQLLGWACQLPHLPEDEVRVLNDLLATVERGDHNASRKKAAMYSHGHGHGHAHSSSHYAEPIERRPDNKQRPLLPLGDGPLLYAALQAPWPPKDRLEGMLRGHFYGERLVRGNRNPRGEGAALTLATLQHLLKEPFDAYRLAHQLNQVPLLHPTTSQQKFRRLYEAGKRELLELGSPSAGCAALRRMCPFVAVYQDHQYLDAALATAITHRDNLALTASLGYLALLWKLLQQALPPPPDFYLQTFLEAIEGLEVGPLYTCQSGAMKGWQGRLKDFLPLALGQARQQDLSAAQALKSWGHGPYLLEVLPSVLYILEKHADDPARALQVATTGTYEADSLGMLVGAALGAAFGTQPGWFLHDDIEELLSKIF